MRRFRDVVLVVRRKGQRRSKTGLSFEYLNAPTGEGTTHQEHLSIRTIPRV